MALGATNVNDGEEVIDLNCNECLKIMYVITGGSSIGLLVMREAIASNAIEHGITYEEMEDRIFKHDTHTE